MRIAYVDSGYKGACVLFDKDKPLEAFKLSKEGKNIDVVSLELVLISWEVDRIFLENITPRPLQHSSSTFYQGVSFGSTLTVCQLIGVPIDLVSPPTWTSFTRRLSKTPDRTSKEIMQGLTKRFFHSFASAYKSKRAKKYHDGIADCLGMHLYDRRDLYLHLLE